MDKERKRGLSPSHEAGGLWWLAEALSEVAEQQGWSADVRHTFIREAVAAAGLPPTDPRRLIVRDLHTQGERLNYAGEADVWVSPAELNAWLAAGNRAYQWIPSCAEPSKPRDRDIAAPDLQRIGLMQRNKEVVLKSLRDAGHDPLALEPRPPGKAWKPKADARSRSGLSTATFDHAWKALNAENRIKERH